MKRIACFGEIVFDIFKEGPKLGGAPLNVAIHLSNLINLNHSAVEVTLHSAIGKDDLGSKAIDTLSKYKLDSCVSFSDKETGSVIVDQKADGSHCFEIKENCAWEFIENKVSESDILIFGSLALKSESNRNTLESLMLNPPKIRLCDLNIREPFFSKEMAEFCLEKATHLKINDDELEVLSDYFDFDLDSLVEEQLKSLAVKFDLELIALTMGEDGAAIFFENEFFFQKASKVETFVDTVGAGDSFTACLAYGLAVNNAPKTILQNGTKLAARICELRGAFPSEGLEKIYAL